MNTKDKPQIDLDDLTEEQLATAIEKKRKQKAQKREQAKKRYEAARDVAGSLLLVNAQDLHTALSKFKKLCHTTMETQHEATVNYGAVNRRSKGGFSIQASDGSWKVTRRRDTNHSWDERSNKGVALIKDFLGDKVKKAAQKEYDIIMSFLERNQQGDLEYSKVMQLLQHKDKYQDQRWVEGCTLVLEGYNINFKAYNYEFKTKNPEGGWINLSLNFSSL